jgi:ligand-binding SRPBCC domain-containing protein
MPLIQLTTKIHAPLERVFDLSRSIDAHTAGATDTGERAVAGRTAGLIEAGESVTWEARHLCIKQRFTVEIVAMERPRFFKDRMLRGAFSTMHHTHRFEQNPEGTIMIDEFHFTAPLGLLGRMAEWLFLTRYMKNFLIERNRVLKQLAETDEWKRYLG